MFDAGGHRAFDRLTLGCAGDNEIAENLLVLRNPDLNTAFGLDDQSQSDRLCSRDGIAIHTHRQLHRSVLGGVRDGLAGRF